MLGINYILLSLLMAIIIIAGCYMAGKNYFDDKSKLNSNTIKVALFLVGLIGYLGILSFTKVLTDFGMPPRFPIFLVIPLLVFSIYYFMGITAIPIGLLIYKTGKKYKTLLRVWNIVGILMVLFVAIIVATSTYQPQIWGYAEPTVKKEFMQLPYLLLGGFLAPSAIFIHLISLIQLNKKKA